MSSSPKSPSQGAFELFGSGGAPTRVRMTITPEQAKRWLETANKKNRPMSQVHYMAFALDMLDGRWKYNGDAIRFGSDGILLDGQHRLMACVDANVPFDTDVIFGLDPGVMPTIDIPMVRTAADIAHLDGVENAKQACALANLLLLHEKHGIENISNPNCYPTKTQITQTVTANARIATVAGHTACRAKRMVPPRILGFCHYLFSERNPDLAERFLDELTQGTNLSVDSPVYHLRERLQNNARSKAKLPPIELIALFFKAWLAYEKGKPVLSLRWADGGKNPEPFPQIGPRRSGGAK